MKIKILALPHNFTGKAMGGEVTSVTGYAGGGGIGGYKDGDNVEDPYAKFEGNKKEQALYALTDKYKKLGKTPQAARYLAEREYAGGNFTPSTKTGAELQKIYGSTSTSTYKKPIANEGVDFISPSTPTYRAGKLNAPTGLAAMLKPSKEDQSKALQAQYGLSPEVADKTVGTTTVPASKANKTDNSQYGIESALAAAQGIGGLEYLLKSKRPVDVVDPLFQAQVNQAIKNASYGYTPEQKSYLDQQLLENRNAALSNVYNAAGGNASVALGNARAVFNDAYRNRLANAAEDESLRMSKQSAANQMASAHQAKLRQLFEDKMNAFNQQQQAGAQLLSSGIKNFIGAGRYRQQQQANDQIQQIDNQYLNGI